MLLLEIVDDKVEGPGLFALTYASLKESASLRTVDGSGRNGFTEHGYSSSFFWNCCWVERGLPSAEAISGPAPDRHY